VTTEIYLNRKEVKLLLPVLERVLNGVATERGRKQYAGTVHPFARPVYSTRVFDAELFTHILSVRNKLKKIGRSSKLRLNAFELASLALSFRFAVKEGLGTDSLKRAAAERLERKLEICRKRAKRSWIRRNGIESFNQASHRWQELVAWLRFEILAPAHRRPLPMRSSSLIAQEHRNFMRNTARDVTVAGADGTEVQHLADLARREVRRRRHPYTMRELINNASKAQLFLANFILARKSPEILKQEYLPRALQMSQLGKRFKETLERDVPNPKLLSLLAKWIQREVDPGYYDEVCEEIGYQLGFSDLHRIASSGKGIRSLVESCKPHYSEDDDPRSYWAVWAARWLLALEPDVNMVRRVIGPAFHETKSWWGNLSLCLDSVNLKE
jgi:hypothetical protein